MKKCKRCNAYKPLSEFYRREDKECQFYSWCISCCKKTHRTQTKSDVSLEQERKKLLEINS